jgi:endonuclease/exonuclease/phosphatase family metal-dependent hydrolase
MACALLAVACAPSARPDSSGPLSIGVFNVLHGMRDEDPAAEPFDRFPERFPLVARELAQRRPSVMMLQETYLDWASGYPHVHRILLGELNAQSESYVAVFGNVFGNAPIRNGGAGFGQTTVTRLPILATANHAVQGGRNHRVVVHVRVEAAGGVLDTYNVHLEGPRDLAENAAELDDVLAFVSRTAAPDSTVVIGGDFNSSQEEAVFDRLRDEGFVDLAAAAGLVCSEADPTGCTNDNLPLDSRAVNRRSRIDYLWARGPLLTSPSTTPLFGEPFVFEDGSALWASDHVGVYAVMPP